MIAIDKTFVAWLNQWRVIIYHDNEYDGEHWFTTEAEADAFIAAIPFVRAAWLDAAASTGR